MTWEIRGVHKMIVQISIQLANCSKLQRLYFGSGTTPTQRLNLFKAVQVRHLAFLASFLSELFFEGIICDSRQQFNLQGVCSSCFSKVPASLVYESRFHTHKQMRVFVMDLQLRVT